MLLEVAHIAEARHIVSSPFRMSAGVRAEGCEGCGIWDCAEVVPVPTSREINQKNNACLAVRVAVTSHPP